MEQRQSVCPHSTCTGKHCSFSLTTCISMVGRVAQSVQRLTTGWTVRGSNTGGVGGFSIRPDRPWDPPSLLYNGYRVFPGGKLRPGRAADPSPPSSAGVMEEQNYTSTHPLGHNRACNGNILPLPYPKSFVHFSSPSCAILAPTISCSLILLFS